VIIKSLQDTVNIEKLIIFLHNSNEQVESEFENTMKITFAPPKMKLSDTNLTKCGQDLCKENPKEF
jgi:hypothetical protein